MTMRMTDRDVIERFRKIVGVGAVDGPIKHIRASDGKRLKDVFGWRTHSWWVINDLFLLFEPWLSQRRKEQFTHALTQGRLKSQTRRRHPRSVSDSRVSRTEIMRSPMVGTARH